MVSFETFGDSFRFPASEYARENVVDLLGEILAILRHGEKMERRRKRIA